MVESPQYYSFWVFKPLSKTKFRLILSTAIICAWKSSKKNASYFSIRETCFSYDNTRQESSKKKILDLGWFYLPPYSPALAPSDFHLFSSLLNEKDVSSRSGENVCGKHFELKTSWILLVRNPHAISFSNYSSINHILLKQKLFLTQKYTLYCIQIQTFI